MKTFAYFVGSAGLASSVVAALATDPVVAKLSSFGTTGALGVWLYVRLSVLEQRLTGFEDLAATVVRLDALVSHLCAELGVTRPASTDGPHKGAGGSK